MHGVGDLLGLGRVANEIEDDRRDQRTATDDRTGAHLVLAELLLLEIRVVGREGDVDDDRHLRIDAVRAHQCAAAVPGDLLLDRRRGNDARRARILGVATQRLEHDERADPVVDRARHETTIGKIHTF